MATRWEAAGLALLALLPAGCIPPHSSPAGDSVVDAAIATVEKSGSGSSKQPARPIEAPLDIRPATIDFGEVDAAGEARRTLLLVNPTGFEIEVIRMEVDTPCFRLDGHARLPILIPARSSKPVAVHFHPAGPGTCSGGLTVEVDSAGGRFKRVPLTGRGGA